MDAPWTGLIGLKRLLEERNPPLELAQDDAHFSVVAKHHKFAETYFDFRRAKLFKSDRTKPNVTVHIGPPGCGKTSWCDETYGRGNWEKLPAPNGGNWWWTTDCCRCDTILIDDVTSQKIPEIGTLLEWTDIYPFKVNVKGGITEVKPKNVVITSNYSMEEWYPEAKNFDALERRITRKIVFKKPAHGATHACCEGIRRYFKSFSRLLETRQLDQQEDCWERTTIGIKKN